MYDFLDEKSHRHLLSAHKKAELSWETNNCLKVTYDKTNDLTSSGFRVPLRLQPKKKYKLIFDVHVLDGDFIFIYVENNNKRLLPRYKIKKEEGRYNSEVIFETNDSFDVTYIGLLFFYANKDYQMKVYKFSLEKYEGAPLTTSNLLRHDNLGRNNIEDLSILGDTISIASRTENLRNILRNSTNKEDLVSDKVNSNFISDLDKDLNIDLNSEATHLSITPSEYIKLLHNDYQERMKQNETQNINDKDKNKETETMTNNNETQSQTNRSLSRTRQFRPIQRVAPEPIDLMEKNGYQIDSIPEPNMDILNYMSHLAQRIVVGVTSTPRRLGKCLPVIESLLNQSLKIDRVYLIVPERFKKDNKPYLIDRNWGKLPKEKFKLIRTPDYGPMTKLVGLLQHERSPDTLYLTADDDHIYPFHWAYYLSFLPLLRQNFPAIYGFKGYLNGRSIISKEADKMVNIDFLCGEYGVAGFFRKWLEKKERNNMIRQLRISKEAYFSDDVLIGNQMAKLGLARILIPIVLKENQWVRPEKTSYADQIDGLNRIKPGQKTKYINVMSTLDAKSMNYLSNRGPQWSTEESYFSDNPNLLVMPVLQNPNNIVENELEVRNRNNVVNKSDNSIVGGIVTGVGLNNLKKTLIFHLPTPKANLEDFEFNVNSIKDKDILYLSFMPLDNPDLTLQYVKYLGKNVRLHFPMIDIESPKLQNYPQYQIFMQSKLKNKYDLIMIDVPYCFQEVNLKDYSKKIQKYYIYRYPELGNIANLKKYPVLVNANYYGFNFAKRWSVGPTIDFDTGRLTNWVRNKNIKHLCWIISNEYYLNNWEDFLYNYLISVIKNNQNENIKNRNKKKNNISKISLKFHIGLPINLATKFQKQLNDNGITNVVLYTISNIFPVLINNADYYFSPSFYLDFYGLWAKQVLNKPLIMLDYGEMKNVDIDIPLDYNMNGEVVLCYTGNGEHIKCPPNKCLFYGYKGAQNLPKVNWDNFQSNLDKL